MIELEVVLAYLQVWDGLSVWTWRFVLEVEFGVGLRENICVVGDVFFQIDDVVGLVSVLRFALEPNLTCFLESFINIFIEIFQLQNKLVPEVLHEFPLFSWQVLIILGVRIISKRDPVNLPLEQLSLLSL